MSALSELRDGRPGPGFNAVLVATIAAVARARNFPPPEGHDRWAQEAVTDVATAFLVDSQTPRRLADLAVHCDDDGALRARLQAAVVNFLRDAGRRTEVGRLVRRVRDVLGDLDGVESRDGDLWKLADAPDVPSTATVGELEAAANRERHVSVPNWGAHVRRNAPAADRETLTRLINRVLARAGGVLPAAEIAKAIAPRLGIRRSPLTVHLDSPVAARFAVASSDPADEGTRELLAQSLLDLLSTRQKLALAHHELSVRQLPAVLGVNRTQAALARAAAFDVLRLELSDDADADAVVLAVVDLAREWANDRTEDTGSPYLSRDGF